MEEFAAKILQQGGLNVFLAGLLVLAVGIISGFGPCNLATIPILISYVAGESDYSRGRGFALSLTFALGSAVTLTLLGVVVAAIGGLFGWARQFLYYVAAFICLVMGLKMLGVITASLFPARIFFRRLPLRQGLGGAFLLGMAAGVAGSQCGTPVLLAILSLVVAQGKPLLGAVLFFSLLNGRRLWENVLSGRNRGRF